jgi:hypothetical protein
MEPFALTLPTEVCTVTGDQLQIIFTSVGTDGNGGAFALQTFFNWDNTLPASANIANVKAAIVAQALSQNGTVLLTSNVNVLMAVS